MIAPWRNKGDLPDLVATDHDFIEVVVIQFDDLSIDVTLGDESVWDVLGLMMLDAEHAHWHGLTLATIVRYLPFIVVVGK